MMTLWVPITVTLIFLCKIFTCIIFNIASLKTRLLSLEMLGTVITCGDDNLGVLNDEHCSQVTCTDGTIMHSASGFLQLYVMHDRAISYCTQNDVV